MTDLNEFSIIGVTFYDGYEGKLYFTQNSELDNNKLFFYKFAHDVEKETIVKKNFDCKFVANIIRIKIPGIEIRTITPVNWINGAEKILCRIEAYKESTEYFSISEKKGKIFIVKKTEKNLSICDKKKIKPDIIKIDNISTINILNNLLKEVKLNPIAIIEDLENFNEI